MNKITLSACAIFIFAFAQNTYPSSVSAGLGTTTPDVSSKGVYKSLSNLHACSRRIPLFNIYK